MSTANPFELQPAHVPPRQHPLPQVGLGALVLALVLLFAGPDALAQGASGAQQTASQFLPTFDPVMESNDVDGQLLGLKAQLNVFGVRPFVASGYGLDSGRIRYRAGLGWHSLSVAFGDWPSDAILGRAGQMSLALGHEGKHGQAWLAAARLWPAEDEASPQVVFFRRDTQLGWSGPFDLGLDYTGGMTVGFVTTGERFQSMRHSVKARWGDLRLELGAGTSSNEAGLKDFAFTQSLRGYDEPLKGHSFWRARLERRVRLLSVPVEVGALLEGVPGAESLAPDSLALTVDASAFGAALRVQPNPSTVDVSPDTLEPGSRLGWGVGLVIGLEPFDFELRLDLFFDHRGGVTPLLG